MATATTTIFSQQQSTITMNNVNFTKRSDLNALVKGLHEEDYAVVNKLLTQRTLGRERSRVGRTALHYIAENGNTDCLELLTSLGDFDLNAVDHEGHTGLHLAVINGNRDSVQILINAKANINCLDNEKHSLVHWATVCGESEILSLLLLHGANASTMDIHNATPLHYAAQNFGKKTNDQEKFNVPKSRSLIILRQLIQHNVNVNVKDRDGREPLLWAASAGSSEAILALVNAGASVDAEDKDGLTALHCAASRGHTDCIETLIGLCGCNVDIIDNNGCTALFYAVTLGHPDCTELLLNYGSEPNRQDRKGRTPAHCASSKGQLETIKQIHKHGANLWMRNVRGELPLHEAILSRRKELVLWLLSQRPEAVNAMNNDGRCCLHLASLSNNVQICKILLDHSADVNPVMRNGKGTCMTPLDAALHRGNSAVAKFLQLHGGVAFNSLNDPKFMSRMLLNRSTDSRLSNNNMMTNSRLTYNNMTNIQCSTPDNHVVLTPDYIISSTPIQHYYSDAMGQEMSEEKKLLRMMEETQGRINISEESEGFDNNSKTHNSFEMINHGGNVDNAYIEAINNNVNRMGQQQQQSMTINRAEHGQDILVHEKVVKRELHVTNTNEQQGLIKSSSEDSTSKGTSSESTEHLKSNEIITRDGGGGVKAKKEQSRIKKIVEVDQGVRGSEDLSTDDVGKDSESMSTGQEDQERREPHSRKNASETEAEDMSQEDAKEITASEETEEMSHEENQISSKTNRKDDDDKDASESENVQEEDEEEEDEEEEIQRTSREPKIDEVDYELLGNVPVKKRRYNKNVKSAHQTNASNSNSRKKKFRKTKSIEGKSHGTGDEEYVKKERRRVTSARSVSPVKRKSILVKNGARSVSPSNIRGNEDGGSVASSRSVSLDVGGQSDDDEDEELNEHDDGDIGGKPSSRKSFGDKKSRSNSSKSEKHDRDRDSKSRASSKKSNKHDDDVKSRSHSRESRESTHGSKSRSSSRKTHEKDEEFISHSRSSSRKSKGPVDEAVSRSQSRKSNVSESKSKSNSAKFSDKEGKSKSSSRKSYRADDDEGIDTRSKSRKSKSANSSSYSNEIGSRPNSSSLNKFLGNSRPASSESNEINETLPPKSSSRMKKKSLTADNDSLMDIHGHSGSSATQSDAIVEEQIIKTSKKKTSHTSHIPKPDGGGSKKSPKPIDYNEAGKGTKDLTNGEQSLIPKYKTKSQSTITKGKGRSDSSKDSGKSKTSLSENSENTDISNSSKVKKVKQKKIKANSNLQSSRNNNNNSNSNSSLTDEIDFGNTISLEEAVRNRRMKQRAQQQKVKLPASIKSKNPEFPVDGRIGKRVGSKKTGRGDKGITSSEEREIEIQNKIISGKKQSVLYEMNKVDKLDKQIYSRSTSRMNESGLSYGRVAKSTDVETTVSVTQAMQVSMRKYTLERHIFSQLLELKRLDMENGSNRTAESMIVKRLVEANRRSGLNYHVRDFDAGFTFRNYEKYLYDQLKLLQAGNKKLLPRFAPSDDIEKLTMALRSFNNKQTTFPYIHEDEKSQQCIHTTHKCHHAAHAYTGIPCAAYIPKTSKQLGPKKRSILPRVDAKRAPGPIQKGISPVESNSSGQLDEKSDRDIPHAPSPITLQLQQGDQKSIFQLPNDTTIDPSKNYYVSLSIKPSLNPNLTARGIETGQQPNLNLSI